MNKIEVQNIFNFKYQAYKVHLLKELKYNIHQA